jgi:hypothetical protein
MRFTSATPNSTRSCSESRTLGSFGSGPRSLEDGKLNDWNGGRGFYYKDHDGHVIELMTMPQ